MRGTFPCGCPWDSGLSPHQGPCQECDIGISSHRARKGWHFWGNLLDARTRPWWKGLCLASSGVEKSQASCHSCTSSDGELTVSQ